MQKWMCLLGILGITMQSFCQELEGTEWRIAELIGLNQPNTDPEFIELPRETCSRSGLYLRKEAARAFLSMAEAATADGIELIVVSAARNFTYQNGIWSRKWQRPEYQQLSDFEKAVDILKYSAMPGTSRHHWGTEIDLNHLENDWFLQGEGLEIARWLDANAAYFGFHQVYDDNPARPGYLTERWHWSYLPLAASMLQAYNECIDRAVLLSLDAPGMGHVDSLHIIRDFVNGIAPAQD
jgi:D-alanyl-D-alanine carboxypeptidase